MDDKKEFSMLGDKEFVGSSLAILVGIVALGSGYITPGWCVILGALAYKSAKKRNLGIVQDTPVRRIIEGVVMLLILLAVFFTDRTVLTEDPFPNLVLPLWTLAAYGIVMTKKPGSEVHDKPQIS